MKAIYKPKPARGFAGALQHLDLQKTLYHSKLLATSTTTVICHTTKRTCILYTKPRQFLPDLNTTLLLLKGQTYLKISSQNRAINRDRITEKFNINVLAQRQPKTAIDSLHPFHHSFKLINTVSYKIL